MSVTNSASPTRPCAVCTAVLALVVGMDCGIIMLANGSQCARACTRLMGQEEEEGWEGGTSGAGEGILHHEPHPNGSRYRASSPRFECAKLERKTKPGKQRVLNDFAFDGFANHRRLSTCLTGQGAQRKKNKRFYPSCRLQLSAYPSRRRSWGPPWANRTAAVPARSTFSSRPRAAGPVGPWLAAAAAEGAAYG